MLRLIEKRELYIWDKQIISPSKLEINGQILQLDVQKKERKSSTLARTRQVGVGQTKRDINGDNNNFCTRKQERRK